MGIMCDKDGSVFVADQHADRIKQFTRTGEFVCEWGQFGAGPGEFYWPASIAKSGLGIYVCDWQNRRIQLYRWTVVPRLPQVWPRVESWLQGALRVSPTPTG